MLRDDLDEAKETAETGKGAAELRKSRMHLVQVACKTYTRWLRCRLTSGVRVAPTALWQRPQGTSEAASVGDGKTKDKEKGKAEHREFI